MPHDTVEVVSIRESVAALAVVKDARDPATSAGDTDVAIKLSDDTKQRMIDSIKRYAAEHMDEDIGELKASMLLDFFVRELGPSIYNAAIVDARAAMHERVEDLDGTCYEPEFGYWKR
jgi:uncharacterized protein (DUF2164 family)